MINASFFVDDKRASEAGESANAHSAYGEAKHSCLIVDDGTSSLETLRHFIELSDDFELVQDIAPEIDVLAVIRRKTPDVIVINLDALHGSVKDLLWAIRENTYAPVVVFVSSLTEFAAEAFTLEASDYLLRPLSLERLQVCFKRVREQLHLRRLNAQVQNGTLRTKTPFKDELLLKTRGRIVFAHSSEIKYISAERNYVKFHLRSESILIRGTIYRLALSLDPKLFVRIHRSAIVNVKFVKELRPWSESGAGCVVLKDGTTLRTGRLYMTEMLKSVEYK